MARTEKNPGDSSLQAEVVVGAGRGALIMAMFGAGLLGWGLGVLRAFNAVVGSGFGFASLLLWAWSLNTIRKGRWLRKQFPPTAAIERRNIRRPFLLVTLVEVLGIVLAFVVSKRIQRPDLGADWALMVVGLHYLPIARIFRAPILAVLGVLITVWCVFCSVQFRADNLVIGVTLGTGILLWLASATAILRARSIAHSLS